MFAPVSYEEVHTIVGQYLYRNASKRRPFIKRLGWGRYRLNRKYKEAYQHLLDAQDKKTEVKQELSQEDLSLSLF